MTRRNAIVFCVVLLVSARPAPGAQLDTGVDLGTAIKAGVQRFDQGDFDAAIVMLRSAKLAGEPDHKQAEALKYIAFSYCVTGRPVQCRHAFEMAFQADPHFALAPGEAGHPMWAPVFLQARRADQDARAQARQAEESARLALDEETARQRQRDDAIRVQQLEDLRRVRLAEESARAEASSAEKRVHQTEQIRSMELWQTR